MNATQHTRHKFLIDLSKGSPSWPPVNKEEKSIMVFGLCKRHLFQIGKFMSALTPCSSPKIVSGLSIMSFLFKLESSMKTDNIIKGPGMMSSI